MFSYTFKDGTEVLAPRGMKPLDVEKEETKHGELVKVKEVKDGRSVMDRDSD